MFGSMMGGFDMGFDDDDLFGGHFRQMNNMMNSMNSMFANPFGGMFGGQNMIMNGGPQPQVQPRRNHQNAMMPFGGMFGGMPNMSQLMTQMTTDPNCHSFSSSTVMTMTNGPDGRPQVYQASSSTRQGPGGVKETKKSVCDSRAGIKKMHVGHHIGERSHIIEREQDLRSGQQEENQEFINLEEDEAETFNQEWVQKTRHMPRGSRQNAIGYGHSRHHRQNSPQLALPPCTSTREEDDYENDPSEHQGGIEITEITEEPEEKEETEINEPSNILEPGDLRRKRDHDHDDVPARKSKKVVTKKHK